MTLRDTELIGKKLVKYGFHRLPTNHHIYSKKDISIEFKLYYGHIWVAEFTHELMYHTRVKFIEHAVVFTPQWLVEEHEKLQGIFKFLRA